jgi:hypothetical protein
MQTINTKNSNKVTKVINTKKDVNSSLTIPSDVQKLTDEQFSALISKKNAAIDKAIAKETDKALKLPLPKKVNLLVAERKVIKASIMEERYKLSFNLNAIKERADNYIALLQTEYKVTIDKNELFSLRAPSFIPYLTENQVKAQQNNGNRWTVSMVLVLIAKYIKNK